MSIKKAEINMNKFQMLLYLTHWLEDNNIEKFREFKKLKKKDHLNYFKITIFPLFIERIKESLLFMAFSEIKISMHNKLLLSTFILCSCFIDYLAYYYSPKKNVGDRYKDFLGKYLPLYNSEKLYTDLRCAIVHNYSEGGSYIFTLDSPKYHLSINSKYNKIYINLENFISDLEHASVHFFSDLYNSEEMLLEAVKSFKANPLIGFLK